MVKAKAINAFPLPKYLPEKFYPIYKSLINELNENEEKLRFCRVVGMVPSLAEFLLEFANWLNQRIYNDDQLVFLGRDGRNLFRAWRIFAAKYGIENFSTIADLPTQLSSEPEVFPYLRDRLRVDFQKPVVLIDTGFAGTAICNASFVIFQEKPDAHVRGIIAVADLDRILPDFELEYYIAMEDGIPGLLDYLNFIDALEGAVFPIHTVEIDARRGFISKNGRLLPKYEISEKAPWARFLTQILISELRKKVKDF